MLHRKFKTMYRSLNPDVKKKTFLVSGSLNTFYDKNFTSVQNSEARYNKISYNKDVRRDSTVNTKFLVLDSTMDRRYYCRYLSSIWIQIDRVL